MNVGLFCSLIGLFWHKLYPAGRRCSWALLSTPAPWSPQGQRILKITIIIKIRLPNSPLAKCGWHKKKNVSIITISLIPWRSTHSQKNIIRIRIDILRKKRHSQKKKSLSALYPHFLSSSIEDRGLNVVYEIYYATDCPDFFLFFFCLAGQHPLPAQPQAFHGLCRYRHLDRQIDKIKNKNK
jgi:hypothetical protein